MGIELRRRRDAVCVCFWPREMLCVFLTQRDAVCVSDPERCCVCPGAACTAPEPRAGRPPGSQRSHYSWAAVGGCRLDVSERSLLSWLRSGEWWILEGVRVRVRDGVRVRVRVRLTWEWVTQHCRSILEIPSWWRDLLDVLLLRFLQLFYNVQLTWVNELGCVSKGVVCRVVGRVDSRFCFSLQDSEQSDTGMTSTSNIMGNVAWWKLHLCSCSVAVV